MYRRYRPSVQRFGTDIRQDLGEHCRAERRDGAGDVRVLLCRRVLPSLACQSIVTARPVNQHVELTATESACPAGGARLTSQRTRHGRRQKRHRSSPLVRTRPSLMARRRDDCLFATARPRPIPLLSGMGKSVPILKGRFAAKRSRMRRRLSLGNAFEITIQRDDYPSCDLRSPPERLQQLSQHLLEI